MRTAAGFLLVLVVTLWIYTLDLRWWWATATMILGAFAVEALRGDDVHDGRHEEQHAENCHGSDDGQE